MKKNNSANGATLKLKKTGKVIGLNLMCLMLVILVFVFAAISVINGLKMDGGKANGVTPTPDNSLVISNGGILDLQGGENNGDAGKIVELKTGEEALNHVISEIDNLLKTTGYRIGGIGTSTAVVNAPLVGEQVVTQKEYDNIVIDSEGNVSGEGGVVGYNNSGIGKENELNMFKSFCYNKDTYIERNLGDKFTFISEGGKENFVGDFSKATPRITTPQAEFKRKNYLEAPNIINVATDTVEIEDFKINEMRGVVLNYELKLKCLDGALTSFKEMVRDSAGAASLPNYEYFYITFKINKNGSLLSMFREEKYVMAQNVPGLGTFYPTITGSKDYSIVYNKEGYKVVVE